MFGKLQLMCLQRVILNEITIFSLNYNFLLHFKKGTKLLSKSLISTEKQIKTLKIIGQRMENNMKDKEVQFKLDNALLRRRRELNNHQWTPVKYIK